MEGAVILNVGIFPDDNLLVVGAHNGMIPDIGVVPALSAVLAEGAATG